MQRALILYFCFAFSFQSWSQRPRLVVESRHTNLIQECTISANGMFFATGSVDNTARVWDLKSGKLLGVLPHRDNIYALAFMDDGKSLLTGGYGIGTEALKYWNLDQVSYQAIDFGVGIRSIRINQDKSLIGYGTSRGVVGLMDGDSEFLGFFETGTKESIAGMDFSPNGKYILGFTAGLIDSSFVYIWDVKSKKLCHKYELGPGVDKVFFSNDNELLIDVAYLGQSQGTQILKIKSGKTEEWSAINGIQLYDSGKKIAGYLNDTTIVLLDTKSKQELKRLSVNRKSNGTISISEDSQYLLTVNYSIEVFDLFNDKQCYEITYNQVSPAMALSPKSNQLTFSGREGAIVNWDLKSGELDFWKASNGIIEDLYYDPSGSYLVSASADSSVIIRDSVGEIVNTFKMSGNDFHSLSMDAYGEALVISEGDEVRLYDAVTGVLNWNLNFGTESPKKVKLGAQNKYLSISAYNYLILYDLQKESTVLQRQFEGSTIEDVEFDKNEERIVVCGFNDTLHVIDIKTGENVLVKSLDDYILYAKFHPDNEQIFVGFNKGEVGMLDIETGNLHVVEGHNNTVEKLAFNKDGTRLFTRSIDGQIIIWDTEKLQKLAVLYAFDDGSWAVVDEEGRFDASNAGDVPQIHFVINMRPVGLSQLKERYYEPGLLQKILAYDNEELRDVSAMSNVDLFPEIKLEEIGDNLQIEAYSEKESLGKISLYINGIERNADISGKFVQDKKDPKLFVATIDLSAYKKFFSPDLKNEINVIAFNVEGYMSSAMSDGELIPKGGGTLEEFIRKQSFKPRLFGIVVGTSNYRGEELDLKFADKDAEYFSKALIQTGKLLFGEESVEVRLLNTESEEMPDKKVIQDVFEEFSEKATASDVLVVYFSGHGTSYMDGDQDQFYYLTYGASNFDLSDPQIRSSYAISTAEIRSWIQMNPVNKRILIIDACSSGKLIEGIISKEKGSSSGKIRALERLKDKSALYVLAGSAANKSSYEASEYGQSLLTYSLLSGMKGQALRDDQFVDVMQLFTYSVENVPRLAEYIGGIQKPILSVPNTGVSFDIGMVDESVDIPLETIKPVFIRSSFQDEDQFYDVLGLSMKVDEYFLNISQEKVEGDEIIFVDVPAYHDAYSIKGRYTRTNDEIIVRVKLFKENQLFSSFEVKGQIGAVEEIVKEITSKVQSLENL